MNKYIKLEDAISKIVNTPTRVITNNLTALADRQHEIIDMLADLPTIDIVHCEDCKYYTPLDESRPFYCPIGIWKVNADDFCSQGERIEE